MAPKVLINPQIYIKKKPPAASVFFFDKNRLYLTLAFKKHSVCCASQGVRLMNNILAFCREEKAILVGAIAVVIFSVYKTALVGNLDNLTQDILTFSVLISVMMWLAFSVVHHAEAVACRLGEPYGTLILTLSVISIEVIMIAAVMLAGENNPTLARDTMFSVLMIVLNGMLGLTLLIGGLKHKEQQYNLFGTKAYLGVLTPLAILGLVLPRFTSSAPSGEVSILIGSFLMIMSLTLYGVFLLIQTTSHQKYFVAPSSMEDDTTAKKIATHSTFYHVATLLLSMLPIILLSKHMAQIVNYGISTLDAPQALGGFLVAIVVLSPEAMSAARSALENKMQRTVNISLGSALSTIGLTIPAVMAISLFTGRGIELGLGPEDIILLCVTLLVTIINFGFGRTNVLQGVVHMVLFFAYIVLLFD